MEVHGDSTARPKVVAGQGVQVGDHNNQVNNFFIAPRVPVEWPHRVGVVPTLAEGWLFRVAEGGVGPGWAATETYCHILCGLGGTGKTQMAAGWAQDAWRRQEVDLLVWVDASTRTGITAVYAQAAADVTGVADADAGQAAARFLAWLAGTDRRWLIVLDDLMKPGDLGGLWPPATASGRTVVTTRRRDAALAGAGRLPWPVGVFTEPEAAAYLTAKFSDRSGTAQEIAALAADLGYLPLALAQASAYIVDRDLSCAEYRDRLADERRRLADLVPEPGALPDEHHQTVATTWALSIELADRLQPAGLARPLLELASVMDPNGIPEQVLTAPSVVAWLNSLRDTSGPTGRDTIRDAIRCLHRLSLASHEVMSPAPRVRVHSLVQRAIREQLAPQRRVEVAKCVADALLECWPPAEADPAFSLTMRSNASALWSVTSEGLWSSEIGVHPVILLLGNSLGAAGQAAAAVDYFQRLHTQAVQHVGPGHPVSLGIRLNHAHWRTEMGDLATALAESEQLLLDQHRVLGSDHPDVLGVRSNRARLTGLLGDTDQAAAEFEDLLADCVRILGPDHPDTLGTRTNLTYWRSHAGDDVLADLDDLLADQLNALGPDHRLTLATRGNIAMAHGEAGDYMTTCAKFQALLADQARALGPDHPDALTTRHNLAWYHGEAGDPNAALAEFQSLLHDRVRVLGPDHPDTLDTRSNIAHWTGETGDTAGAIAEFEALLIDQQKFLGPDHPDTLETASNLETWRSVAN